MKCVKCGKDIDEVGLMYDVGGTDKRCICPRCFIVAEKHGSVHVLFSWGLVEPDRDA